MLRFVTCTLAAAFALAGILALPAPAYAGCEGVCENIAPPGEFCRRCMDAGHYTGASCKDVGQCGCIYVQCPELTGDTVGRATPAADPLFVEEPLMTPAQAGACGEAGPLAAAA